MAKKSDFEDLVDELRELNYCHKEPKSNCVKKLIWGAIAAIGGGAALGYGIGALLVKMLDWNPGWM